MRNALAGLQFPDLVPSIPTSAIESALAANATKLKAAEATSFLAEVQKASLASEFAARLRTAIAHFDASLDSNHEVGMRLVTFGQAITFHVEEVRFHNPSLIFFRGTMENGGRVELIQHVTQISFCLMAVPKPDPNQPKRRFGFGPPESPAPNSPTGSAPTV
jgi:hypothetical protein